MPPAEIRENTLQLRPNEAIFSVFRKMRASFRHHAIRFCEGLRFISEEIRSFHPNLRIVTLEQVDFYGFHQTYSSTETSIKTAVLIPASLEYFKKTVY